MTVKKIISLISLSILIPVFFLYLDFADDAGTYKKDSSKADAIIVLAGGLGRVDKGAELFENGMAGYLIIAGAGKDATFESVFFKKAGRQSKNRLGLNTERIILGKESKTTYENALEAKRIIEDKDIKSIILLTSFYHMRRASYIFSRTLPSHVVIHLYPVSTPNFDETTWWRGQGAELLAGEFVKFYWYRFWIRKNSH